MLESAPKGRERAEQHFTKEMPGVQIVWESADHEYPTIGEVTVPPENLFMKTKYYDFEGQQHQSGAFIVYTIALRTLHEYYRRIGIYPPEDDSTVSV